MAAKIKTAEQIFSEVEKSNSSFAIKDRYRFVSPAGHIIWEANPGPQNDCLYSNAFEILTGGSRGGGKSDGLVAFMVKGDRNKPANDPLHHSYVNHKGYRGIVFRRNATDLEEFISRCADIYGQMGAVLKGKPCYFEWPTGARVYMNHLEDVSSAEKYKGPSYVRVGIEELTLIANKETYLRILGSCRSPFPEMKAQVMSTTNPDGPGQWVKDRFVEVFMANGKMVPWGKMMRDAGTGLTRVFIPSKLSDNPFLRDSPTYVGVLKSQEEHLRRAWLDGDWNALSGVIFTEFRPKGPRDHELPEANHVVPAYSVALQPYWNRWIGGDWGYRHYAAFYKFCQQPGGRLHCYDEFCRKEMGAFELGIELAKWCIPDLDGLPEHQMELYLGPDAFVKNEIRSTAEQIQGGINMVLGPGACFLMAYSEDERSAAQSGDHEAAQGALQARYSESAPKAAIVISRASNDRIGGVQYIRELLRWKRLLYDAAPDLDYARQLVEEKGHVAYQRYLDLFKDRPKDEVLPKLLISGPTKFGAANGCPQLIKCLQSLVHDTRPGKNPEDVMKVEGDDPYDGFRYGCMAHRDMGVRVPKAFWVAERMEQARSRYTDPAILGQIAAMQNAKYDQRFASPGPITFPRRGAMRHWSVQ